MQEKNDISLEKMAKGLNESSSGKDENIMSSESKKEEDSSYKNQTAKSGHDADADDDDVDIAE